jgi:pyridoxal phosphate enzyme (YggS family)
MNPDRYQEILNDIKPYSARLVAVSKTRPQADITALFSLGQRIFGENKVQELTEKYEALPKDIDWHFIGHLQSNKVKYIAPYVGMIHAVDSLKLLEEIDRQAQKNSRVISCLLQVHIAQEGTKFGMDRDEINDLLQSVSFQSMKNICLCGLMGMATNTDNEAQVDKEFAGLKTLFDDIKKQYLSDNPFFKELSMGMSADYLIALKHGVTLIRIGSDIFGHR